MLAHAREAVALASERDQQDLESDRVFYWGMLHVLQIIGEAAYHVSSTQRSAHPEIRWSEMIAMRHRLVHGYDRISTEIVWRTIRDDVPELIVQLERLLADDSN